MSGTHYYRNLPKSDARIIILILIILFSILQYHLQNERHEQAVKTLVKSSICNVGVKNGGSRESQEIFKRASEMYAAKTKNMSAAELAAAGQEALDNAKKNKLSAIHAEDEDGKPLGKTKMQRDPLFLAMIDEVKFKLQCLLFAKNKCLY